jgi:adenosylcobinamide-GDP ribazoletransferase
MIADLCAAFALLTTIPIHYPEGRKPGYAFAYFPLVGLLIGGVLWLVAVLPWPTPEVRAFAVVALWVIITGGLHLDGFGDACDGLFATTTPERRLEIMKDPRTGSWGVIGLVLLLLGKWVLLITVEPLWLIVPPVVARWAMVLAAYHFPYARTSGIGGYFREGLGQAQWFVAGLSAILLLILAGWLIKPTLVALTFVSIITVFGVGRWAATRLGGGLTGDIYGAIGELTELLCLLVLLFI